MTLASVFSTTCKNSVGLFLAGIERARISDCQLDLVIVDGSDCEPAELLGQCSACKWFSVFWMN